MDIQPSIPSAAGTVLDAAEMRERILAKLRYQVGKRPDHALARDWFVATAFAVGDCAVEVGFGGTVAGSHDADGTTHYVWHPGERIKAVAYDTPIVGGGGKHANTLRLWSARSVTPLHLEVFNRGDHEGAQRDRVRHEAIS